MMQWYFLWRLQMKGSTFWVHFEVSPWTRKFTTRNNGLPKLKINQIRVCDTIFGQHFNHRKGNKLIFRPNRHLCIEFFDLWLLNIPYSRNYFEQKPSRKFFLKKRSLKISFIITFHDFVNFKSKSIINGIRDWIPE